MKLSIRPFRKNDARHVAVLLRKLAAFHGETIRPSAAQIRDCATGPRKLVSLWLAFDGTKPIGFIGTVDFANLLRATFDVRVEWLFVEDSHRRLGIATRLIQEALKAALAKGCSRFDIGALPQNKLSNKTYAGLGLEKKISKHVSYRADKALMKRLIEKPAKDK